MLQYVESNRETGRWVLIKKYKTILVLMFLWDKNNGRNLIN